MEAMAFEIFSKILKKKIQIKNITITVDSIKTEIVIFVFIQLK